MTFLAIKNVRSCHLIDLWHFQYPKIKVFSGKIPLKGPFLMVKCQQKWWRWRFSWFISKTSMLITCRCQATLKSTNDHEILIITPYLGLELEFNFPSLMVDPKPSASKICIFSQHINIESGLLGIEWQALLFWWIYWINCTAILLPFSLVPESTKPVNG